MSNAELFDHLIKTDETFRERYKGLAETISSEEGGFFAKSWAWIAKKATNAKEWQDKTFDKAVSGSKKIFIFIGFALVFFAIIKFNLLKDIKKFLKEIFK